MFNFEKRDDGFLVFREDGRAVAGVDVRQIVVSDHMDGDPKKPRLAQPQTFERPYPREKWQIHFTGVKLTPPELEAFLKELDAQQG